MNINQFPPTILIAVLVGVVMFSWSATMTTRARQLERPTESLTLPGCQVIGKPRRVVVRELKNTGPSQPVDR